MLGVETVTRTGVTGLLLDVLILFKPGGMVHRAVEVQRLPRIVGTQHHPGVRGQSPSFLGPAGFAELAAGAHQHPGEAVNRVVLSRHG